MGRKAFKALAQTRTINSTLRSKTSISWSLDNPQDKLRSRFLSILENKRKTAKRPRISWIDHMSILDLKRDLQAMQPVQFVTLVQAKLYTRSWGRSSRRLNLWGSGAIQATYSLWTPVVRTCAVQSGQSITRWSRCRKTLLNGIRQNTIYETTRS